MVKFRLFPAMLHSDNSHRQTQVTAAKHTYNQSLLLAFLAFNLENVGISQQQCTMHMLISIKTLLRS